MQPVGLTGPGFNGSVVAMNGISLGRLSRIECGRVRDAKIVDDFLDPVNAFVQFGKEIVYALVDVEEVHFRTSARNECQRDKSKYRDT